MADVRESGPAPLRAPHAPSHPLRPPRGAATFQDLLVELSALFVNLPADQVDQNIGDAQKRILEFLGLDHSGFGVFTGDGDMHLTHSYAVPGHPAYPTVLLKEQLPWFVGALVSGRTVRLEETLADMPPEAVEEREYCRRSGFRAILVVPVSVGGAPLCVLGVGSFTRAQRWTDLLEAQLRLVAEVFASALARKRSEQARCASEERVRCLYNELAHAGRVTALGQISASLAHEVNQPLCAVLANARSVRRLLQATPPDLQEALAAIDDIAADADRASQIIARTRAMIAKAEPEYALLDLDELVREVVTMARHDLLSRQIAIRVEPDGELPEVRGDRVQLQQVILNLLLNAAEAVEGLPAERREIVLRTEQRERQARVAVRDRGPGIDLGMVERLFEPFCSTKPGGMGMGLAIARSLVEAHGGVLTAEANAGAGVTFAFTIPITGRLPVRSP